MARLTKENFQSELPEIVISHTEISLQVSRLAAQGKLLKIAPKLYTSNLKLPIEQVVARNCWQIVAYLFPGDIVVDRTAIENKPAADGSICICSERHSNYQLPGLVIRPRRGPGPTEEDIKFIGGLSLSCPGRAYLENMAESRQRGHVRRTLTRAEIEAKLETVLRTSGEDALNKIRDQAKRLAPKLGLMGELETFQGITGALLGTKKATLFSDLGKARQQGKAYDPERVKLFEGLWQTLRNSEFPSLPEGQNQETAPFFEAYFSNFIEGTQFEVNEAKEIVFEQKIPLTRPEDAHDVLGTYRVVSDRHEMERTPNSFEEFEALLKSRHATCMVGRPEKSPGYFKTQPNQAGATLFVNPELVRGTLEQGYEFYRSLNDPFAKAIFMGCLVTEVHPFEDGNGRIARIMMNAELVAAQQQRMIIPIVFRTEYMQSLKAFTNSQRVEPFLKVIKFSQEYTNEIDFSSLEIAEQMLRKTNAFEEPADAMGNGAKLIKPSQLVDISHP